MKRLPACLIVLSLLFSGACGDDGEGEELPPPETPGDGDGDEIASYSLAGSVIDFATGQRVDGQATIVTDGISPPPTVGVQGADFEVTEIPPFSVFHLLAGVPPMYHNTYAAAFEVTDNDITGAEVHVVSEAYLASLFAGFDLPVAQGGVLIAQVLDENGAPIAGVSGDSFEINNAIEFTGPFFLDAELQPDARLDQTSESGYVVFFDVPEGLVAINATVESGLTLTMAPSPAASTTVTLASVSSALGGDAGRPQNVSFEDDVMPIFELRGCTACHRNKEIGNDIGGLSLDDRDRKKVYKMVAEDVSDIYGVPRIDLANPANSLMLTQPSPEDPRDAHPNITFLGPTDPDYITILVWIEEGALEK